MNDLFDSSDFVTRDRCGDFPQWMVNAWILPSVGLFLLYVGVACVLAVVFWQPRPVTSGFPRWALPFVSAFFIGCGGGHLMNALAFHWPAYRLFIV